ncbi:MAG: FHA domain-containing protein [Candidatus Eisenbacteria bacterium]|nr:FHA domain-containing protein [Candidatus Eisenbacteria bacterium]
MEYLLEGNLGAGLQRWSLRVGRNGIGREQDNAVVVAHRTVSRHHAEIRIDGDRIEVEDLQSRNGTFVNEGQIATATELRSGDRIRLGSVELALIHKGAPAARGGARAAAAVGTATRDTFSFVESDQMLRSTRMSWDRMQSEIGAGSMLERGLFRVVTEAGALLVQPHPLEEVFGVVLDLASRVIPARRILLLTREKDDSDAVVRAAHPAESAGGKIMLSRTMIDAVLQGRESILVSDAQVDPRFSGHESIIAQQIRSALVAPLFDNERVLGLIYADTDNPALHYDQDQLRAFTMLGNLIAVKITTAHLLEDQREKERMEQEMATAARIQQSLLPTTLPEIAGYEILARQIPCRHVAGDLFDAARMPDGAFGIVVGDVSGKGMGAALLMSHVMASLRLLCDENVPPGTLMERVHRQVLQSSDATHFVTLFFGRLDAAAHRIEHVNAGHNPPLLMSRDGSLETLEATGLPAGLLADSSFEVQTKEIPSGGLLCIYSDGITEAEGADLEFFGEERLIDGLKSRIDRPLQEILDGVMDDVRAYTKGAPPQDDITLFLLRRA